jgi:hypothetical protein
MQNYGWVDVQVHEFLTLAPVECEWSASRQGTKTRVPFDVRRFRIWTTSENSREHLSNKMHGLLFVITGAKMEAEPAWEQIYSMAGVESGLL